MNNITIVCNVTALIVGIFLIAMILRRTVKIRYSEYVTD